MGDLALKGWRADPQLHDRHHNAERALRRAPQPDARGFEAGDMADLGRQKDSQIEVAYVIPIYVAPAADTQPQASIGRDWRLPDVFQKMRACGSESAESLIDDTANEREQRDILRASQSFFRQQKRFRADKVAMFRDKRLNSQILKGGVVCCVCEKKIERLEKAGIFVENRT